VTQKYLGGERVIGYLQFPPKVFAENWELSGRQKIRDPNIISVYDLDTGQPVITPRAREGREEIMPIKKSELYSSLWKSCDELRGGMDASQYKDYVLVMLFMKYVTDKAVECTP
jgi:hypothetical protein